MISQVSDPDQKKIITVLLFSIFFSLYYYYVLQHCYFQGCIFFPFPPPRGGGILSSCWGVGEENQVGKIGQKRKGREIMK